MVQPWSQLALRSMKVLLLFSLHLIFILKQRHRFADKAESSRSYGFCRSHVRM